MRVLITGITGMIGSHLARHLLDQGCEVAGLSRATSASRWLTQAPPYRHYSGDILDRGFLRRVWLDWKPDCIFHLAAQAFNGISWEAEETTYTLNITGSRNVFSVCREISPQARVIPACSSAEYGFVPPHMIPICEDTTPLRPVTPYGVSKAAMEMMARQFHLNYGMDMVLPRLFIHVGPGHPPATALQTFARQLAAIRLGRKEPQIRVGNLDASRDFVDVRDGVEALWLLARSGVSGEAYNIATGKAWKIGECLRMLIEIAGVNVQVVHDPMLLRLSDEPVLLGDNSKLRKLGWTPRIPFRQTLTDIYQDWFDRLQRA